MQQLHFFTGKGGTGKTTNAILFALKNARIKNSLLCSLDPAHNIYDILDIKSDDYLAKFIPGLQVMEPSINEMLKDYLSDVENDLMSAHGYLSSFNLLNNFNIIKYSPGIEEYAIFHTFKNILNNYQNNTEIIIMDMPPTALSLRFFSLAKLSILWLEKLIELRQKIILKKEYLNKIQKKTNTDDKIILNLLNQKESYKKILKSLQESKIHIVLNPEPVSISESLKFLRELESLGYRNFDIFLNKSDDSLSESFLSLEKKYPVIRVPKIEKPVGLENLLLHLS
ncbi:MAG TPA: hypothetical protein ENK91_10500 [Bacteroidetes bacterium]|nr:hypothetical protein [Bacteroidota bacterium]